MQHITHLLYMQRPMQCESTPKEKEWSMASHKVKAEWKLTSMESWPAEIVSGSAVAD